MTGPMIKKEIEEYYSDGREITRLESGAGRLEKARTLEILQRFLPQPPAHLVDIGGGAGAYAFPLAALGYQVSLIDPVASLVQAAKNRCTEAAGKVHVSLGDARELDMPDNSAEAVLMLGPLYHLPMEEERVNSLKEAFRILKPDGFLFAVGISKYASFFDGIRCGYMIDPDYLGIVKEDLRSGHHFNPTNKEGYFTTAYFHEPNQLRAEVKRARFKNVKLLPVEGPAWLFDDFDSAWETNRKTIMGLIASIENERSILGASAHIMAVGQKPRG